MMDEKKCSKCKKIKELNAFNKSTCAKDGLRCECKECQKIYDKKYMSKPVNRKKRKKYHKEYYSLDHVKIKQRVLKRQSDKRHPLKGSARNFLRNALLWGYVTKPDRCSSCGKVCIPEGHHTDYLRPVDVEWLCSECHWKKHTKD